MKSIRKLEANIITKIVEYLKINSPRSLEFNPENLEELSIKVDSLTTTTYDKVMEIINSI